VAPNEPLTSPNLCGNALGKESGSLSRLASEEI
jgi:hypothetical protein